MKSSCNVYHSLDYINGTVYCATSDSVKKF